MLIDIEIHSHLGIYTTLFTIKQALFVIDIEIHSHLEGGGSG